MRGVRRAEIEDEAKNNAQRISAFLCDSAVNVCVKAGDRRGAEDAQSTQSRDRR